MDYKESYKLLKKLRKYYPKITPKDFINLRQQLLKDFLESLENDYYFEICNEDYMNWFINQGDHQDYYLVNPMENEKLHH